MPAYPPSTVPAVPPAVPPAAHHRHRLRRRALVRPTHLLLAGLGALAVVASGGVPSVAAPAAPAAPTPNGTTAASATNLSPGSQHVPSGTTTKLVAHVRGSGHDLYHVKVNLYAVRSGGKLVPLASGTTNTRGLVTFVRHPSSSTRFRATFPGLADRYAASTSHDALVYVETLGQRAVREASTHYGAPYEWGATGPSRFDCSGFTRYVYGRFGRSLPHNSGQQYNSVAHVDRSQMRAGDLVFFYSSGRISHVGIYAGDNQLWAATHSGDVVRKENFWTNSYYVGRVG